MATNLIQNSEEQKNNAILHILGVIAKTAPHMLVGASIGLALISLATDITGNSTLPQWIASIAGMFGGEAFGILYDLYRDITEGKKVDSSRIVDSIERAIPSDSIDTLISGNERLLRNLEWQQSWMAQVKLLLDRDYRLGESLLTQFRIFGIQFEALQQFTDRLDRRIEQLDEKVATRSDAEEIKQLIKQGYLTPQPPPLTWQFLTVKEREQLTNILAKLHIILTGGPEGRLSFLYSSGLDFLAGKLPIDAPANVFAGRLVAFTEGQDEELRDPFGYHPLGALCFHLFTFPETPRDNLYFLAELIQLYELIRNEIIPEELLRVCPASSNTFPWRKARRQMRVPREFITSLEQESVIGQSEASHVAWYMLQFLDELHLRYLLEDYFPETIDHFKEPADLESMVLSLVTLLETQGRMYDLHSVLSKESQRYSEFFRNDSLPVLGKTRYPRRVFICHDMKDASIAQMLGEELVRNGWLVCRYPINSRPGESRLDFHDRALATSGVVILIVSQSVPEDHFLQLVQTAALEISIKPQENVRLVVIPIDDCPLRPMMYALAKIPFNTTSGDHYHLIKSVADQISGRPLIRHKA